MNDVDEVLNTKNLNTSHDGIRAKDWHELKMLSKQFFTNAPTMNYDELENAHKCFGLAYISFEFPDTAIGRMQQTIEGPIIFGIVNKAKIMREIELEKQNG